MTGRIPRRYAYTIIAFLCLIALGVIWSALNKYNFFSTALLSVLLADVLRYGYAVIFVIVYLAALAVPLPTNTILLAAGAFAAQGYFDFALLLFLSLVANVLGDITGYFLARRYGRDVLSTFRINDWKYLSYAEDFVRRYTRSTIILSRFAATLNIAGNVLAGLADIKIVTFVTFDIIGNFASIAPVMFFGFLVGINWQNYAQFISVAGGIILTLVLVFWIINLVHWMRA